MATEIVYARVMGINEFPLDMLRYDSCCPATEEDSSIIRNTFTWQRSNLMDGNWVVVVKKILREKRHKNDKLAWYSLFTVGRWNSFGCSIMECDSVYVDRKIMLRLAENSKKN